MGINARQARIYVNEHNLSTGLSEINSAAEQEELDVTSFEGSSGFRDYITGFRGGTVTMSGFYDFNSTGGANETEKVFGGIFGSTSTPVVTYAPDGQADGNNAVLMKAIETSYEVSASIGDALAVAAAFRQDDSPDFGNLLHSHSTEGSTGGSASVQWGSTDGSTNGGVGHLHITELSTGEVVVVIQHSSDDSTWADLITFTTSTGPESQRIKTSANVKEFVREARTKHSSTSSKYVVSFARR